MKLGTVVQILASVWMVLLVTISLTGAEYLQQSDPLVIPSDDELQLAAVKRPFCNAFTGCGRKRSEAEMNAADTVGAGGSSSDLYLKNLGRHILRMKAAVASQLHDNYQTQPWNNYKNQRNQLRTPWIDYLVERKKRMAVVENDSTNVRDAI